MKRARRMQKKLKVYLVRVYRDVQRKLVAGPSPPLPSPPQALQPLLTRIERVLTQRQDKQKLYSVHASEVECVAKGKAHKPYECGVKVSGATTQTRNCIVGMHALVGHPYDGHALIGHLEQVESLTGKRPSRWVVDQAYRGHTVDPMQTEVLISRQRRPLARAFPYRGSAA
jgi:IS5 family transposase